ncbi:glycosyltransferase family 1 protein [Parapedobacter sp. ISTM3]|uniref:glycosyltransferase family 4 protein n=1 Tax=Parapedobacter sp. ISTM3 TaxID=2800130 RepID=UPI001F37FEA1|nr:glycosyltransferase family 1 protein [Parapedobacter sp. ISTM3]
MMQTRVLIDSRWDGDTGIGKLYREVMARMPASVSPVFVQSQMGLGNLFTPLMLARAISSAKADVFYSPSFMPPLYSRIPYVFTIHDLMHFFYYTPLHRLYYQQVLARLARRARKIITVSHFSKRQLVELLGIDEQRIAVVYNGVDMRYHENTRSFVSERPYFLYVGNRRKNKNIPTMLSAFARARIPQEFMFYLSGHPDEELTRHISQLGLEGRVRFLGFVAEEDMPALYKGAYATLFVSLMEGFGLPVIESMASGTPVITSSVSALPEIAGDAGVCVDPSSPEAIAIAIEQLAADADRHHQLRNRGIERAAQFSWDKTAAETWSILLENQ